MATTATTTQPICSGARSRGARHERPPTLHVSHCAPHGAVSRRCIVRGCRYRYHVPAFCETIGSGGISEVECTFNALKMCCACGGGTTATSFTPPNATDCAAQAAGARQVGYLLPS